jgi:dynein heavy chain
MIVRSSFEDWEQTKWREINSDSIDIECKKFVKELRGLDKEIRAWDAYNGVETDLKNMLTSLKATIELQNPAMRDRHWQELMLTTGVEFSMDENTKFSDMLKLNLHKFEDEVRFVKF